MLVTAGACNAVVSWFEADVGPGATLTSLGEAVHQPPPRRSPAPPADSAPNAHASERGSPASPADCYGEESEGREGEGGDSLGQGVEAQAKRAVSWRQAVYYLDEEPVELGQSLALGVLTSGDARLSLRRLQPLAPARARQALLPQWHYDMLNDGERNAAYQSALTRAVARLRASGVKQARSCC